MTFLPAARLLLVCLIATGASALLRAADQSAPPSTFKQYCVQCHGKSSPMAGVSLDRLISERSVAGSFQQWRKVVNVLEQKRMPPEKMPQPSDAERHNAVNWVRTRLNEYAAKHDGDPGRVTVRRLTSAEYAYTIRDLTGLDLKLENDFANDAVGGEGFANYGDVQFMQDANLERYLAAARRIADHAVIGAGPLDFFADPGKSGFELSAINRINEIYRANGFRAVAGEGAKPYGLDRYAKAFYASWRYHHRGALGEPNATLEELAAREGVTPRFIRHVWSLLNRPSPTYPISDVTSRWKQLPVPSGPDAKQAISAARAGCDDLQRFVIDWTRWLFAASPMDSATGDDRVFLLTDESLKADPTQKLRYIGRTRGQKIAKVYLSVTSMNPNARDKSFVIWRHGTVRPVRGRDRRDAPPPQPVKELLGEEGAKRFRFGQGPDGQVIDPDSFVVTPGATLSFDVPLPQGVFGLEVQFDTEIHPNQSIDAVLRPSISDKEEVTQGRTTSAFLAVPASPGYLSWKAGVLEFGDELPQNSHGEAAPSDRDPIPVPWNNAYNQPERDRFHYQVKYYRTDQFLVDKMLDDDTRTRLEYAWADLLTSFEYHDVFLRFITEKYGLDLKKKGIADLTPAEIEALPAEPRKYVHALRLEYDAAIKARQAAQPRHVEDCVEFASNAWRRPLTDTEKDKLRSFYVKAREGSKLDHPKAIRALLTRILVAPAFLYRLERTVETSEARALSSWELASRLSYFLWSSIPDDELRRAAQSGDLNNPELLARQVKRMLADPKSRRLSTEFFGQWLGFYRFDQFRGVDTTRFPEFTDDLKSAMYDEAVSFFEHIIRNDRPVRDVFFGDYTFLNAALAKHYGVKKEIASKDDPELVEGAGVFHRGGMLRLGAVLTATSAPLRTSPVKRGDWVLRRVLGTPTPPPPADAGSIPADEKLFGGLSLQEKLAAHQRNASCASCHTRIDPLGFPLERYDPIGRWRDQYSDGKPINDSSVTADKTQIAGVDGLVEYLKGREQQLIQTFAQKLVGFALGRTILLSDQPLIDRMTSAGGDAPFSRFVSEIAASRQFRYRRGEDTPPAAIAQTATRKEGERR